MQAYIDMFISMQNACRYFFYFIIFSNFIIIFAMKFQINIKNKLKTMLNKKSILLITAHPDDEIMFYSPTLKAITNSNSTVKILCLSNGNYDKIGHIRTEEYKAISKALKMEDNEILNIPSLQDNITMKWEASVVSEQIEQFLNKHNDIDTIMTFDEHGVTNHPNHISCYDGLVHYINKHREELKMKKDLHMYLLDSFNPLMQYTGIIPFITMYLKEHGFFNWNCMFSYKYMSMYKSQFNFLRKLHVVFSSYSYSNSFTEVEIK